MKITLTIIALLMQTVSGLCLAQGVRHSKIGDELKIPGMVSLKLITKHQNFNWGDKSTLDGDISSPKSVRFRPDGKKYYVNSLEGGRTVVYDAATHSKIKVIKHFFDGSEKELWAKSSGLFPFRKYMNNQNRFMGKPVESTFTHDGRYLWVPYYRRSYDINAQDPSAVAIIDTEKDSIVRMMETGPLPKMITASPDGKKLAVTHWGDNTVGMIDISSSEPSQWHYTGCVIIEHKLKLDFSTTQSINRDAVSGFKLRGTVFMPDSKYLLVCPMSGTGIAVVDVEKQSYMGMLYGSECNVRHLLVKNGYLYLSANLPGKVQRIPLDSIRNAIAHMEHRKMVKGWQTCKVFTGTRTISISPSGNYLFAACSYSSVLAVVDTKTMKCIGQTVIDSYPVGLDVSPDGLTLVTTSQGNGGAGGNAVNVFAVSYTDSTAEKSAYEQMLPQRRDTVERDTLQEKTESESPNTSLGIVRKHYAIIAGTVCLLLLLVYVFVRLKKGRENNEEQK